MHEESNGAKRRRLGSAADVFKVAFRVLSVLGLLITTLTLFYTALNPLGAVTIIEKLADTTRTPFPTYTPQPTILVTEIYEVTHEVTREVIIEVTREVAVVVTPTPPSYSDCKASESDPMAEKDVFGQNRPTVFLEENIQNGPLTLAKVSACLVSDEGKKSDPKDIEEGYENEVIFYDIFGKPYVYRLIIGGRSLPSMASRDNLIFSNIPFSNSSGRVVVGFMTYDQFEKAAQDLFKSRGSTRVNIEFYATDNASGHLSDYYLKIFQNSEIYAQIVEAIKTGVGYPEEVPEDFFIWGLAIRFCRTMPCF